MFLNPVFREKYNIKHLLVDQSVIGDYIEFYKVEN